MEKFFQGYIPSKKFSNGILHGNRKSQMILNGERQQNTAKADLYKIEVKNSNDDVTTRLTP
jgi:hypothetical protein